MKYFYDTEFIEGTQKKWWGKTKPTIDLISIGIVSEENDEYYAISKDFNLNNAWNRWDGEYRDSTTFELPRRKLYWIRENVLKPIWKELYVREHGNIDESEIFTKKSLRNLIKKYGKTNKIIAKEIFDFVNPDLGFHTTAYSNSELKEGGRLFEYFEKHNVIEQDGIFVASPEFYGWYSAYDHVVLCWLYGKMKDLPKGFPMYTNDLKQMLRKGMEDNADFPVNKNSHNALDDAKHHFNIYKYITKTC